MVNWFCNLPSGLPVLPSAHVIPLSKLPLPGCHDVISCPNINQRSQTQSLIITQELEAGCRYCDFRVIVNNAVYYGVHSTDATDHIYCVVAARRWALNLRRHQTFSHRKVSGTRHFKFQPLWRQYVPKLQPRWQAQFCEPSQGLFRPFTHPAQQNTAHHIRRMYCRQSTSIGANWGRWWLVFKLQLERSHRCCLLYLFVNLFVVSIRLFTLTCISGHN